MKIGTKFTSPVAAKDGKDILTASSIYDSHSKLLHNTISRIKLKSKQIAEITLRKGLHTLKHLLMRCSIKRNIIGVNIKGNAAVCNTA